MHTYNGSNYFVDSNSILDSKIYTLGEFVIFNYLKQSKTINDKRKTK